MNTRETLEKRESEILSPFAVLSANATRARAEEKCLFRTEFQRDRDRIIHSKAFRRLKHKTQVFISPDNDHFRTRLTHTLEVAQIARTIARALALNEDLTEAIALGHDLGHTPFGHSGEEVLNRLCPYGFHHSSHSLRVVDILEDGGLNLTNEVRDGISLHSGEARANTLEGKIVSFADRIAYINHDIDDALRGGVLVESDIPREFYDVLGATHGRRINNMIIAIVSESDGTNDIKMEERIHTAMLKLRQFMFDNVYKNPDAKAGEANSVAMLEDLYSYYLNSPEKIPNRQVKASKSDDINRVVCDYLASMTDLYATDLYRKLFPQT
ncbi:MAG: deoxyguanosinetriphosphate triphosphohydrolase [Oscillospiraceae bacterium]|nr:deoxyguanosinetriphosphate triphosphohydrolase [Oscillospiraceae bacterium]